MIFIKKLNMNLKKTKYTLNLMSVVLFGVLAIIILLLTGQLNELYQDFGASDNLSNSFLINLHNFALQYPIPSLLLLLLLLVLKFLFLNTITAKFDKRKCILFYLIIFFLLLMLIISCIIVFFYLPVFNSGNIIN